jgi:DNA-binding NarL/FixJ family response regulator
MSIKVLVVDDHAVVREGVKRALNSKSGFEVDSEAASFAEAQGKISFAPPDVAVVDIHLQDSSGLELVTWIREISSDIGVIVFSMSNHPEYILAAMDNGASGFLDKNEPITELVKAIEIVALKPLGFYCKDLPRALSYRREKTSLTLRELEILQLLPSGKSYEEMAAQAFISESTLKTHLQSIYRKLVVRNRVEAINEARRLGILPPIDPSPNS